MNRSITFGWLLTAVLAAGCGEPRTVVGPSTVGAGSSSLNGGGNAAQNGAAKTVPFKGDMEGTSSATLLQPPLAFVVVTATGNATHLGRFSVQMPHTVNFATASGQGTFTFTAANGDTVTGTFSGQAQVGPITSIVENAMITGGTGRFAGAAGTFTLKRLLDQAAQTTTGSFEGTITAPGAGQP
jgi:hypothetical protein